MFTVLFLPVLALVEGAQLFLDALFLDKLVPVQLGLVQAAHLGLLSTNRAHDA